MADDANLLYVVRQWFSSSTPVLLSKTFLSKKINFELLNFRIFFVWRDTLLCIRHIGKTFFVKWALVLSYTIACPCNIFFWRVDYLFFMCINYAFHVGHAAAAYFNVVFTEQLVHFVVPRKVLIN